MEGARMLFGLDPALTLDAGQRVTLSDHLASRVLSIARLTLLCHQQYHLRTSSCSSLGQYSMLLKIQSPTENSSSSFWIYLTS